MTTLDQKIFSLKSDIFDWKQALDESKEQPELRCHIDKLQAELDKLLEDNRAEEWIEGWG